MVLLSFLSAKTLQNVLKSPTISKNHQQVPKSTQKCPKRLKMSEIGQKLYKNIKHSLRNKQTNAIVIILEAYRRS